MLFRTSESKGIVVVVDQEKHFDLLLRRGYRLATLRGETLSVLVFSDSGEIPDWVQIPPQFDQQHISIQPILPEQAGRQIAKYVRANPPALVVFAVDQVSTITESRWSPQITAAVHRIHCPVAILAGDGEIEDRPPHFMVPCSGDENSRFAVEIALVVNPQAELTVVSVPEIALDDERREAFEQDLQEQYDFPSTDAKVTTKVLYGEDSHAILLEEVKHYDGILIGASRTHVFQQALLGGTGAVALRDESRKLIDQSEKPVVMVREYQGWLGSTLSRVLATGSGLFPALDSGERIDTYRNIRRAARPGVDFFMMIGLSAGIAALGLILNSPAVIIGAMLIAPLMSTIIGMGMAIVLGDRKFLLRSLGATLRGSAVAIAVGVLIGLFYLNREGTGEMLGRTGPTLLDLLVATVSGIAAAYALCRRNVSAALPGVAIAVALVPPLATLGLFFGMGDLHLAYGAFLLFVTNLAGITFASGVVFTLFGFRPPNLQEKDLRRVKAFQRSFLVVALLLLAVFSHLTVISVEEIAQSTVENTVESVLRGHFQEDTGASMVRWDVVDHENVVEVFVHLSSTADIDRSRLSTLTENLSVKLETPARLTVTQIPSFSIDSTGVRDAIEENQQ